MSTPKQCQSSLCVNRRASAMTIVFCTKRAGHEGYHRGFRAQWDAMGRVTITEPCLRPEREDL